MNPSSAFVGWPSVVCSSSGSAKNARYARLLPSTRKSSASARGPSSRTSSSPVSVFGTHRATVSTLPRCVAFRCSPGRASSACPSATATCSCARLRLRHTWSTSRRRFATRCAFPLAGPPLADLVARDARVTVVVEPPALPLPGAQHDPRPAALATALDELDALGVPDERGHAARRGRACAPRRAAGARAPPPAPAGPRVPRTRGRARRRRARPRASRGRDPRQSGCRRHRPRPRRVVGRDRRPRRARSAARRVRRRDGPARRGRALARASVGRARVAAGARQSRRRYRHDAGLLGVSLVLDHPRLTGRFRGYPHEPAVARARGDLAVSAALLAAPGSRAARDPRAIRAERSPPPPRSPGLPSVAHAEALVRDDRAPRHPTRRAARRSRRRRAVDRRAPAARAAEPDHLRRHRARPRAASVARRLPGAAGRDARPRALADALVRARDAGPVSLALRRAPRRVAPSTEAESAAAADARALDAYRAGRACHPRLPFADWAGCQPALSTARPRHRRRQPRRGRRTSARVRAEPLDVERARHGARRRGERCARRHPARAAVLRRSSSAASPRRGTSCGPARSS